MPKSSHNISLHFLNPKSNQHMESPNNSHPYSFINASHSDSPHLRLYTHLDFLRHIMSNDYATNFVISDAHFHAQQVRSQAFSSVRK